MDNATINRLVAEHVMGWRWVEDDEQPDMPWWVDEQGVHWDPDEWYPSEAIYDAWRVVEHLEALGAAFEIYGNLGSYEATFDKEARNMAGLPEWIGQGSADSVPLAICLAALEARGVDVALYTTNGTGPHNYHEKGN